MVLACFRTRWLVFILTGAPVCLVAQEKFLKAVRTPVPPKIDGIPNDSCWQFAPVAKDFLTNEPVFGNPPAQQTEVRFVYDDEAIYAAYYLYDTEMDQVIAVLNERDKSNLADELMMGIDTYFDETSAFRFQVTAAGVQTDRYMSPFINRADRSWDAVWQSSVHKDERAWYVEMKIPFSALRFPRGDDQKWGIQFGRFVGRTGEFTTWSPVNPNIGGGPIRQWGTLTGIKGIRPPVRLSLWPYITVGVQRTPFTASRGRFKHDPFYAGGMDLKFGINQSFTLDMSLIPDFSQVLSDNTILNLTPFEVKYEERRQFFTEGTDLFNKAGIFYSRRIGSTPAGYSSVTTSLAPGERIETNPTTARLINATKVTGRTTKGLGIGMLNAVTAKTYAAVVNDSLGSGRVVMTEPLTNFNVLVLDQSLKHNSKVGIINTNVSRGGTGVDANVSALDFILNSKDNTYALIGTGIFSHREGEQRTAPQTGYHTKVDFARVSKNFRFELFNASVSKDYNPNDLGILTETNFTQTFGALRYFSFKPFRKLLNWNVTASYAHTHTLANGRFQKSELEIAKYFLYRNFSSTTLVVNTHPRRGHDIYEPRVEGYHFIRPKATRISMRYVTDTRRRSQVQVSGAIRWFEFPAGHLYYDFGVTPTVRLGNKSLLNFSSLYTRHANNQGFAALTGNVPVFGLRHERTWETVVLLQYLFSPFHSMSLRVRDYWSKVAYEEHFRLSEDGVLESFAYTGNTHVNLTIFNIDFIYTWQFAPGSFMKLSVKSGLQQNTQRVEEGYLQSLDRTLAAPKQTSFSVRMNYFIDYARLEKMLKQRGHEMDNARKAQD